MSELVKIISANYEIIMKGVYKKETNSFNVYRVKTRKSSNNFERYVQLLLIFIVKIHDYPMQRLTYGGGWVFQ